jgi:hypothetical protein
MIMDDLFAKNTCLFRPNQSPACGPRLLWTSILFENRQAKQTTSFDGASGLPLRSFIQTKTAA